MIKHGLTARNILHTLPEALKTDKKTFALASVIADALATRSLEVDKVKIYPRIDELPEVLLNILAHDFKVDWYGYNYPLSVKRSQFRESFQVRRKLGTPGAMELALKSIYPHTEVEEWFEYGGDPYCFRVILDITNPQVNLSHEDTIRNIMWFKNKRSHLQDGTVIFRSHADMEIGVTTGYIVYQVRSCGTYPVRATQGGIADHGVIVIASAEGVSYVVPMTGKIKAGICPDIATQGKNLKDGIALGGEGAGVAYSVRFCGSSLGGLMSLT